VIDSSPEPEAAPRKKESALTPPPELSEEEKAKLAQAVRCVGLRPAKSKLIMKGAPTIDL
jgi:hypothetical protein